LSIVFCGVFVLWWSIQSIGIPRYSAWFAKFGESSALSRTTIKSGFISSSLWLYCWFRSGKDLIVMPLPLASERFRIK